jgi:hypothetical protein
MKAEFTVELAGTHEWERDDGETCEQSLFRKKRWVEDYFRRDGLPLAWLVPVAVSFGEVTYDDEQEGTA